MRSELGKDCFCEILDAGLVAIGRVDFQSRTIQFQRISKLNRQNSHQRQQFVHVTSLKGILCGHPDGDLKVWVWPCRTRFAPRNRVLGFRRRAHEAIVR